MTTRSARRVLEHSQQYGVESLDLPELVTLVLNGGRTSQRAKVQQILTEHSQNGAILNIDIHELLAHEIDEDLAYRVAALLELTRRLSTPAEPGYQIRTPSDAVRLVRPTMRQLKREQMRVLALDTKNRVVFNGVAYQGTVNSSVLRVAELYRPAIVRNCPAIVVCHNHPSGDPEPSSEDIAVTEQLIQAGKLLEIELVDHIVIGEERYTSLREKLHW